MRWTFFCLIVPTPALSGGGRADVGAKDFQIILSKAAAVAALAAPLLAGGPAPAQTVDHGTLEQIFGQPVTTSATGSPKLQSDVPVSMAIITAEDIRRSGATDLPTLLARVGGLETWRWTLGYADVAVRGYNQPYSPRLLVLINGRQVYFDHYGLTNWLTLPVELAEIRQIEVVRGPNTALFGFNAVGGVVNIITVNPLYDDVDTATVRVGTQKWREMSAVNTVKLSDRAAVRLSLGGHDADDFGTPVPDSEAGVHRAPRRRSASLNGLVQVTEDSQLGLELTRSETEETGFFVFYTPVALRNETQSAKIAYTLETGLGLVEASLYRNWLYGDSVSHLQVLTPFTNQVTVARLQDLFKIGGNHSFRLAGEYRHNTLLNVSRSGTQIGYDIGAASAMWDWSITRDLSLTTAARLDHLMLKRNGTAVTGAPDAAEPFTNADYDRAFTEVSFNSGLVYKPTGQDTLRLSVGRGVQAPSLLQLGFIQARTFPGGRIAMLSGSPFLDPSVVMNYEAAWERILPLPDTTVRLGLFHQTTDDLIATPEVTSPQIFIPPRQVAFLASNIGRSRSWGLEAGLDGKAGPNWRWGLTYTYEIIADDLDVNQDGRLGIPVDHEAGAARHRAGAHLGYTAGPFEADLFASYASAYAMPRGLNPLLPDNYRMVEVPAFAGLDARLAYRVADGVTLAVEGQSLNQAEYRPTSGPAVERRLFLSVRGDF